MLCLHDGVVSDGDGNFYFLVNRKLSRDSLHHYGVPGCQIGFVDPIEDSPAVRLSTSQRHVVQEG